MTQHNAAAIAIAVEDLLKLPAVLADLRKELAALRADVEKIRKLIPVQLTTVAEAARRLDMDQKTVRRHIKKGLLRAVHIGDSVRVDLSALPEALDLSEEAGR